MLSNSTVDTYEKLSFKTFFSPTFGLVIDAPDTWIEVDDPQFLQIVDPTTDTQLTASAYENNGVWLEQWANIRFSIVDQQMPYLQNVKESYGVKGKNVSGIASDYKGVFPDSGLERYYLVMCLRTDAFLISITITTSPEVFEKNEKFYRWLLQNQLDIYEVKTV